MGKPLEGLEGVPTGYTTLTREQRMLQLEWEYQRMGGGEIETPQDRHQVEVQIIRDEGEADQSVPSQEWQSKGNCYRLPLDVMFPSDVAGVDAAKAICRQCVVKTPCLEDAILHRKKEGVWGGTSERERRRIIQERTEAGTMSPQQPKQITRGITINQ